MSIFREYDVRGIADTDLTNPVVWALGRALGDLCKAAGDSRCYVGSDVRLSSPRLRAALVHGLKDSGLTVGEIEAGPTPLLYFAAAQKTSGFETSSGIMVTGSHNPPEYNGFKMVVGGRTLFGEDIQKLRLLVESYLDRAPAQIGSQGLAFKRIPDYVNFVRDNIRTSRKLKVVIDAGNGAAGELALKTYQALGIDVVPLFCEPDGSFPNHHPDPTVPKNLRFLIAKVLETKADVGIGFDGDGDRIGAVSASGRILYGDQLVMYFARDILKELPGATIISEVKSSQVLYDMLEKWGAKPILWKTGHSLIKAKLKETKAALAGEMSGHMFFAHRFFGFDDAIYSGARLVEGLSQKTETLDEFLDSLPQRVNTPELRVDCEDSKKFGVVSDFVGRAKIKWGANVNDIDGARVKFESGWGLIRASNTQPVLVLRFESVNRSGLESIRDSFASILKDISPDTVVPAIE